MALEGLNFGKVMAALFVLFWLPAAAVQVWRIRAAINSKKFFLFFWYEVHQKILMENAGLKVVSVISRRMVARYQVFFLVSVFAYALIILFYTIFVI